MNELVKTSVGISETVGAKNVCLYLDGRCIVLQGNWQWEMNSDAVFCSDVILSFPQDFSGTKAIIHPDDVDTLKKKLVLLDNGETLFINFRIITTYGEIKFLLSEKVQLSMQPLIAFCIPATDLEQKESTEKKWIDDNESLLAEKDAARLAEEFNSFGTWHFNTVTSKAFYSDNVYRIYGLPPQSLNAHLHTFNQYIHPEERNAVEDAFELSFIKQAPLQVQFRIVLNNETLKMVEFVSRWAFNAKGERVINGVIKDITTPWHQEQRMKYLEDELAFQKKLLLFNEQSLSVGLWQVNLLTRKPSYSDNYYRIFGIKPQDGMDQSARIMQLVHPDDKQMVEEANRKMILEHAIPDIEYRIIKENGRLAYIRQKAKLLVHGENELVMAGIAEDITLLRSLTVKATEAADNIAIKHVTLQHTEALTATANWVWELETGEITWSEGFYNLLGYKINTISLSQKLLLNFVHPDDQKLFTDNVAAVLKHRISEDFEFKLMRKGEPKNIKASFRLFESEGRTFFLGLMQDITQQYSLQKIAAKQTHFTRLVTDAINDRLLVTDLNYRIIEWNKRCEETFGKEKDEAINRNFFDVFPDLKTDDIFSYFRKVLDGETVKVDYAPSRLSKLIWNIYLAPLKNDEDEVIGIIHILRDATKEYSLQKELSERLFFIEKLVESSIDRIVVLNSNMNFVYWNKKAEEFYKHTKQQVIGKNIMDVFPASVEIPSYIEFRKVLKGETIHVPVKENTNAQHYQESFLIPIKNEKEEVTAILWVMHDVTQEYQLRSQQVKADTILNTIEEGFYELDSNLCFQYVNKQCEQLWGVKKEEVLGRNIWEVFPQALDSSLYFAIQYVMDERTIVRREFISPIINRWISATMVPSASGIIVFYRDIHPTRPQLEQG